MNKWILAALMVMGTLAAPFVATSNVQAAPPEPAVLQCDNTKDDPANGTYKMVIVKAGASCYLRNAEVLGGVRAVHGAVNVDIINTNVGRNIFIQDATGDVRIGVAGCGFDPTVGNNIKVFDSHNVAICWMTVNNNIMVTGNDGRIQLRDNTAGNNIRVTNNLPLNLLPTDNPNHGNADAIRLFNNVAGNHIFVRDNSGRPLFAADNTPEPRT